MQSRRGNTPNSPPRVKSDETPPNRGRIPRISPGPVRGLLLRSRAKTGQHSQVISIPASVLRLNAAAEAGVFRAFPGRTHGIPMSQQGRVLQGPRARSPPMIGVIDRPRPWPLLGHPFEPGLWALNLRIRAHAGFRLFVRSPVWSGFPAPCYAMACGRIQLLPCRDRGIRALLFGRRNILVCPEGLWPNLRGIHRFRPCPKDGLPRVPRPRARPQKGTVRACSRLMSIPAHDQARQEQVIGIRCQKTWDEVASSAPLRCFPMIGRTKGSPMSPVGGSDTLILTRYGNGRQ